MSNRRERVGSVEPADRATERPDVPAAEDRWSVAGNIATGRALGEGGSPAAVAALGLPGVVGNAAVQRAVVQKAVVQRNGLQLRMPEFSSPLGHRPHRQAL